MSIWTTSQLTLALLSAVMISPATTQERTLVSLAELTRQAARDVSATARIALVPGASASFQEAESLEPAGSEHIPNYLRALGTIPAAVRPYSTAFNTLLYGGTVEPETKAAMGLEIGRVLGSPYVVVHLRRILAATDRGKALLRHFESGDAVRPEQDLAIRYAARLTEDVHGIDDERFRQVRGYYTDAQIVELTLTVSFFNYYTRFEQAVHLPVESWALDSVATPPATTREKNLARVSLISDRQLEWAAATLTARNRSSNQADGFDLVNSQRAMNLVPDVASAWRAYTGALGPDSVVSREIKLQVSFAVSTSNGCRYCTLHQVMGLRRLGVSTEKLLQMQKDDSALTPRELTAVTFARKLTRSPASMTDDDYNRLRAEFGERGALEVVLQTCNFAFMNRFTDNLGLPSEDEAIRVYREVYGGNWK